MANEYKNTFKEALKMRRRQMGAGNRKKTKSPPPIRWLYPHSSEIKYFLVVNEEIKKPLKDIIDRTVEFKLQDWIDDKKRRDSLRNYEAKNIIEITNKMTQLDNEMSFKTYGIDNKLLTTEKILEIQDEWLNKKDELWKEIYQEDSWFEDLQKMINEIRAKATGIFKAEGGEPSQTDVWLLLLVIAGGVLKFNGKQWEKSTKQILGFEFNTQEDWWDDVREAWMNENFNILENWSDDFINRVQETIFRGVRNGLSYKEIIKQLRRVEEISKNRAKKIVRDQIGKLNGIITKKRMTEAGINVYKWLTSHDERVRGRPGGRYPKAIPSHWAIEGKICSWDDNGIYTNESDIIIKDGKTIYNWKERTSNMPLSIPGEAILCRCDAIAYWDPIIEETDYEIEAEAA